ncbi:MAG TPA: XdhC family protein, partial [Thermodesulfobacteriota bacterium]|nr:XdhC family protein [Thermodesulfobacteriota bacterium]
NFLKFLTGHYCKTIFDNLIAKGVKEDTLKRVYAPIGLDINAETPEEIAVSIMAEIVQIYRSDRTEGKSVWGSAREENYV